MMNGVVNKCDSSAGAPISSCTYRYALVGAAYEVLVGEGTVVIASPPCQFVAFVGV